MPRTRSVNAHGPGDAGRPKLRDSEVLDVAVRVFYQNGYAASSVQMIADELGILKGSLYYYISGKEELLYRLLQDVHAQLGVILENARSVTDTGPLDRLRTYVRDQVEYAARHVPQIAIYYRDGDQLSEGNRQEIFSLRREHQTFVRGLIKEAQTAGLVPTGEDPDVLADLIFGSFIWTYRWYDISGPLGPSELAETCARFAVRAISAGGQTPD